MSVICRLRVGEVDPGNGSQTKVRLNALYSPDDVENSDVLAEIKSFFEATPAANFEMWIRNEAAAEQFQIGDEFYVQLEKIPTEKTVQAIYAARSKTIEAQADVS